MYLYVGLNGGFGELYEIDQCRETEPENPKEIETLVQVNMEVHPIHQHNISIVSVRNVDPGVSHQRANFT